MNKDKRQEASLSFQHFKIIKQLLLLFCSSLLIFTLSSCDDSYQDNKRKGEIYHLGIALDYKNTNVTSLNGPINDCKELSKALIMNAQRSGAIIHESQFIQSGYDIGQNTLTNPAYPTKEQVLTYLKQQETLATDNDLTIISYSGHGDTDGSWLLATRSEDKGISIHDGEISNQLLLSPLELITALKKIKGDKLLLIDSCYCGNFISSSTDTKNSIESDQTYSQAIQKLFSSNELNETHIYVLSATTRDNTCHEPNSLSHSHVHGYFSKALLEGLGWNDGEKGKLENHSVPSLIASDGVQGCLCSGLPPSIDSSLMITLDDLYAYIKENQEIPLEKQEKYSLSYQHPMVSGGRKDLILFSY